MRKRINSFLHPLGLSLEKLKKLEISRTPILENVFDTTHQKSALLSYIKGPFINKLNLEHTNLRECYSAGEIFRNLGYNVDVANFYEESSEIDYNKYEVIYGMGAPIENSLLHRTGNRPVAIVYATGCAPTYVNHQGAKKVKDFYKRTGMVITSSSRFTQTPLTLLTLADRTIILGNKFTRKTFEDEGLDIPLSNIPAFFYDTYDIDLEKKNFAEAQKHILWFGSGGLIHKGLDLAIDSIKELKNLTLHICGASAGESDFFDYYKHELSGEFANIINHGFIKLESDKFKELMNLCGAVLFPTVSEGGSPSLLNIVANGGLIPILPAAAGLDTGEYAINLSDLKLQTIISGLKAFSELTTEELKTKSISAKNHIRENYTFEQYYSNLRNEIAQTLQHAGIDTVATQ